MPVQPSNEVTWKITKKLFPKLSKWSHPQFGLSEMPTHACPKSQTRPPLAGQGEQSAWVWGEKQSPRRDVSAVGNNRSTCQHGGGGGGGKWEDQGGSHAARRSDGRTSGSTTWTNDLFIAAAAAFTQGAMSHNPNVLPVYGGAVPLLHSGTCSRPTTHRRCCGDQQHAGTILSVRGMPQHFGTYQVHNCLHRARGHARTWTPLKNWTPATP